MKEQLISSSIEEKAPLILAAINKAKSILLHCHPSPDPDSVGSALAMRFALEQLGKKATVIKGDSEIPQAFMHFPGATEIEKKNFFEVEMDDFDLFISLDSASLNMISKFKPVEFPASLQTICIDHHPSNKGYANIDLVEPNYPATCQILFDLFKLWNITIDEKIAANLFIGIYTDSGGFKFSGTTARTFAIAGELVEKVPEFVNLIGDMENSKTYSELRFEALALRSVETFLDGKIGLSIVSYGSLMENNIQKVDIHAEEISPILRSVAEWIVSGILIEIEPGKVKMSLRSKDGEKVDVSKLASAFGGGGHKAAAGATLDMPLDEAKKSVVAKAKELYSL